MYDVFPAGLTCDAQPIEQWMRVVIFIVSGPWHIIPKADGCQGDETKIKRLQKVPVPLHHHKYTGRDDQEHQCQENAQNDGVDAGEE